MPNMSNMTNDGEPGAAPLNEAQDDVLPRPGGEAGKFAAGSYADNHGSRDYALYVPGRYEGQPVPLVVMLHGCMQSVRELAALTRMNNFAERYNFIVAYPSQAADANRMTCWNWFHTNHQHRGRGEPAIIAGITRQIMSAYSIDGDRVYVAGISAGAAMAVIIGATYPDLYAACGVHSGIAYGAAQSAFSAIRAMRSGGADPRRRLVWPRPHPGGQVKALPLIIFHGDSDQLANKVNAEHIATQWSLVHSMSSNGHIPRGGTELKTDMIQGKVPVPHGRAYTRTIYYDAHDREVMEKWIVHEAGHAWAGGLAHMPYSDPLGPDASAEMVRFFLNHPRARET